jgi:hypothetical protein
VIKHGFAGSGAGRSGLQTRRKHGTARTMKEVAYSMKKTGKRWLAALLAVIMTVGVLPMSALADTPSEGSGQTQQTVTDTEKSTETTGANLVKTAEYDPTTDEYTITLESWVTGTVKPSTTKPMDIVLVLDVSGSMDEKFTSTIEETYKQCKYDFFGVKQEYSNESYYRYKDNLYYKLTDGNYAKVTVTRNETGSWYGRTVTYTYTWNEETEAKSKTSTGDWTQPGLNLYYKTTESSTVTKLAAMKTAVNNFIDSVAAKSSDSKISIVKFAGTKSDKIENTTYWENGYEYN